VQAVVRAVFSTVSVPMARVLARFDARIDSLGLSRAAAATLADLGATFRTEGPPPPAHGPLLVVSNHPGAYDALCLVAALGRDDAAIVASDRVFLRALPALARHLVFVPEAAPLVLERARGLRRALRRLEGGGAIVHFGAGRIEPDPAFPLPIGVEALAPWPPGTGALVRGAATANGPVVAALVAGVHSARAKRLRVIRLAERRGLTTLAPLLQVSLRRYRRVDATVRFAPPESARHLAAAGDDDAITAVLRGRLSGLWPRA
jgi:hypothetical protein